MWEYIGLLMILLLWKITPKKKGEWVEQPWSLRMAKAMQGISAYGIILHHSAQRLERAKHGMGALAQFKYFGVLFVGIFFFFSGYGLMKSYQSKPDYFKHFFRNRFSALLIPYLLCNFTYYFVHLGLNETFNLKETILVWIGYHPLNTQIWFVVEIAVFYLVFYLLYRWTKNVKVSLAGMFLFLVAFIGFCMTRGHGDRWFQGEWWYNTALLFGIGIAFATFEESILTFVKRTYLVLLPVFLAGTIGFYCLNVHCLKTISYWSEQPGNPAYGDKLTCLLVQYAMIICFVMTILLLMMKIKMVNPVTEFLGKHSLEIYLLQNIFLTYFRKKQIIIIKNDDFYVGAVIVCTIAAAFIMHLFDSFLVRKIRKK